MAPVDFGTNDTINDQTLWCFGTANIWPNRQIGWAISRSVAPF